MWRAADVGVNRDLLHGVKRGWCLFVGKSSAWESTAQRKQHQFISDRETFSLFLGWWCHTDVCLVMYNKQILLVLVWSTGLSYGFSFTVTTLSNQDGSSPESFLKVSVCSALSTSVTSDWTSVVWSLYVLFALFMVFAFSCVRSCFTLLQVKTQHFLTLLLHNKGFKYLNN